MNDLFTISGGNCEPATGDLFDRVTISSGKQVNGSDYDFLRKQNAPSFSGEDNHVSLVDLFCGAGGISLGIAEAVNDLGLSLRIPLAVDFEAAAVNVYKENFSFANAIQEDLSNIFSSSDQFDQLTDTEKRLREEVGKIDILVGGPPCQGHSDLNNYSRRKDPKNSLYFIMARAAYVLQPSHIIIENVLGARHDKNGVVHKTISALQELGYRVEMAPVDLTTIGVPQTRRRLIIIASKVVQPDITGAVEKFSTTTRNLEWAIKDLEDCNSSNLEETPSKPSKNNLTRINYLFEHDLDDLPNHMRPPCHAHGNHSYKSIYGRLKWSEPSQTITSGFYSMCMGRYVHPSRRRTLTAREAARLQFFPDYFTFGAAGSRTAIAKIIGNAVPPKLSYIFAYSMLCSARP
ncbi:DNA cytosine methyltransferase [Azotobacter chroococcum]|uniref:DNA (cytosine-5-)-methyltransferase n=1 Tax=Azotobacter chroococcum TaxID=353 RepID=A0AA44C4Y1_9GAMM|nr:DNA cytosine methyltransferase [Azotobacter chroococcum]NHN75875.1 DNA cytosine methyltransferase [Azotobacter chroococcum]